MRRITVTPEVEANGFGTMSRDKMRRTVQFINDNVDVTGAKLTAEGIMVDGYLPSPAIKP